ncbi:MAG: SDR family oxidoreductase [Chromatiales bacterium]|nr:SDR family oxidoreductase [Chromatiales bacterium]
MHHNVLITGGTGFVGRALSSRILLDGKWNPRVATRIGSMGVTRDIATVLVPGLTPDSDWRGALSGVSVVVHAAARVHIMKEEAPDPLGQFRFTNVHGTLNLARQAAEAGVRRFVFISSIKVNGEQTESGRPFHADDPPTPEDAYGLSKWEAEQGLLELARETGMEVVIIRPPLVYGPGVKGNFATLLRWVAKGVPLPLGAVRQNRRSLVGLDNLMDLIVTCLDHPAAANQVFLASDGEDLSTTELLERIGRAMGKPTRLLPVPVWALQAGAILLGKRDVARRLLGSLQVDISKTRDLLGWEPPVSVDEGLRRAVAPFGVGGQPSV